MSSVLNAVASRMGVGTAEVDELLNGQASNGVAGALGTSTVCIKEILDGPATAGCAASIGVTAEALEEIRRRIGQSGVIGLVLGVAIGQHEIRGQRKKV